ncbi:MAG: hypothetical protein IJB19_03570 [Clostridia bacterium]|nr:hypothetical protein [Clostridia bacterium]
MAKGNGSPTKGWGTITAKFAFIPLFRFFFTKTLQKLDNGFDTAQV